MGCSRTRKFTTCSTRRRFSAGRRASPSIRLRAWRESRGGINLYFGLARGAQVEKRSAEVMEIAKWVDAQYDETGNTTSISDQEMETQVRRHLPRLFESARLAG